MVPAGQASVTAALSPNDFLGEHCRNCNLYLKYDQFKEQYPEALTSPKAMRDKYAELGKCSATYPEIENCKQGIKFEEQVTITIPTHPQFWLYNATRSVSGEERFRLYAMKEKDGKMLLKPYNMANVYGTAKVCWGRNNRAPGDLRSAYNLFWSSPFNADLCSNYQHSLINTLKTYDPDKSPEEWADRTSSFFGPDIQYFTRNSRPCEGALLSYDPKVLLVVPKSYRVRINGEEACIGWIRQGPEKAWFINFNGFLTMKTGKLRGTARLTPLGPVDSIY